MNTGTTMVQRSLASLVVVATPVNHQSETCQAFVLDISSDTALTRSAEYLADHIANLSVVGAKHCLIDAWSADQYDILSHETVTISEITDLSVRCKVSGRHVAMTLQLFYWNYLEEKTQLAEAA